MAASPRACKANTVGVQLLHEQPSTTKMATSPRASETSTEDAQLRYLATAGGIKTSFTTYLIAGISAVICHLMEPNCTSTTYNG